MNEGVVVTSYTQCPGDPAPDATPPVDIPGEVLKQFKRVRLPESAIIIQPPGGATLVNLPTIFSTTADPFTRQVTLDKVDVKITLSVAPQTFRWHHGDGTSRSSTEPGDSYLKDGTQGAPICGTPERQVDCLTHTYLTASDSMVVSVDTTWAATYQVNSTGPWRKVPDTVTITGDAQSLDVREALPQLVDR